MKSTMKRSWLKTIVLAAMMVVAMAMAASATTYWTTSSFAWDRCPTGGSQHVFNGYSNSTSDDYMLRFTVAGNCSVRVTGFDDYGSINVQMWKATSGGASSLEPYGTTGYSENQANHSVNAKTNRHIYYALTPGTYYVRATNCLRNFKVGLIVVGRQLAGGSRAAATYMPRSTIKYGLLPAVGASAGAQWFKFSNTSVAQPKIEIKNWGVGSFEVLNFGPSGQIGGRTKINGGVGAGGVITLYRQNSYGTKLGMPTGTYYVAVVRDQSTSVSKRSNGLISVRWYY